MFKVSKLPGAPGGNSYALRFPEGMCPIPMDGVLTQGPLPPAALIDPWLEVQEGEAFPGVPTSAQHLKDLKQQDAKRKVKDREVRVQAEKELERQAATGGTGKTEAEQRMESDVAHLIVRAISAAIKAGEGPRVVGPETWKKHVNAEVLEQLADKETVERLRPLMKLVERLNSIQKEAGGWDAESDQVGYSERTLTTNQVLLALGMAQRAGAPVPGAVLRRGLEYLRAKTNDGHVIPVGEKGFDRRLEAGRSSGAGAALRP